MHPIDDLADPLAVLVTFCLVGWVALTVWRAQRDLRAERLASLRTHQRRVRALRRMVQR